MAPRHVRSPITFALAVVLLSPAAAQITKVGSAYSFRVKLSAGTVIKYKMAVSTSISGMKMVITNPIVQNVSLVKNGVADVILRSGPLMINGKAAGAQALVRMSVDRLGKLVGGEGTNSGFTAFPPKPIQQGATWKARVPLPTSGMTGGSNALVTTTYQFVKMTTYKGQRVAQLSMNFRSGGQFAVDGSGTTYVLAKDGLLLHSSMKMHVSISASMEPATVNAEVSRG